MLTTPFAQRIRQGAPLLVDGAMGTMLHEQGSAISACFDELCLSDPLRVAQVHRAFLYAGAEVLESNTFSANRYKLDAHGLTSQLGRHQPRRCAPGARSHARQWTPEPVSGRLDRATGRTSETIRPHLAGGRPAAHSVNRPRRCSQKAWIWSCWKPSAT